MDLSRLSRKELVAVVGAALLILGLFLPWYATSDNPNANINGSMGQFSGWDIHTTMRWPLLLAAIAPFVLAYIIIRQHKLSWARGELTAVVAIIAFGLVAYNGIIKRPGEPTGQIGLEYGFWIALVGTLLMVGGSALRSSEAMQRQPPGV